jgi:hypothetical protein
MPVTQFDDPVLHSDGRLAVGGPFILTPDERQRLVGDVIIRFLVIQDADRNQSQGAASCVVEGTATWTRNEPDHWDHVVSADRTQGFEVGARVRGIGLAVVLKQPPATSPDEPPFFETVTWCVSKHVVAG